MSERMNLDHLPFYIRQARCLPHYPQHLLRERWGEWEINLWAYDPNAKPLFIVKHPALTHAFAVAALWKPEEQTVVMALADDSPEIALMLPDEVKIRLRDVFAVVLNPANGLYP